MRGRRSYDPLVAHGFGSWLDRLKGVLTRSGKRLLVLVLVLLGMALPSLVLYGLTVAVVLSTPLPGDSGSVMWPLIVGGLILGAGWLYLISATGLAAMKVMTSDAAGEPVRLGQAFRTSLRLAVPTSGSTVMAWVAIAGGALACLLPGLYVMVAVSLLWPAMVFERQDGLTRSRELVHRAFWPTVGRFAFLGVIMSQVLVPIQFLVTWLLGGFEMVPTDQATQGFPDREVIWQAYFAWVTEELPLLVSQVVFQALGYVVWLGAVLVTYVELRAGSESGVTTERLFAEATSSPDLSSVA